MGTFQPAVQRHPPIRDQTRSVSSAQPTEQKWLVSAHNATDQMQKKVRAQQKEQQNNTQGKHNDPDSTMQMPAIFAGCLRQQ